MDNYSLFKALLLADDETDVETILDRAGLLNDSPTLWVPYSRNEMNWNQIGNQQADPTGALVEKVINAIDAMLMAECYKRRLDPQGSQAPRSMTDAIETFFSVPAGKIENLTPKEQTALADNIHVVAVGSKRDPSYLIIDRGEGQTPESFHETFLSLKSSNKSKIPFVQGKFSSGGTGILPFCGQQNYELIVSKRHPSAPLLSADGAKDAWGFTLVRRMFPGDGRPLSMYVYLAPHGKIPSFRADAIQAIPGISSSNSPAKAYAGPLTHGTCIKLYNYKWKAKSIATTEARYELERFLHSPCLPFRISETRDYKANYYSTTLSGVWATVSQAQEDEKSKVETGFPSDGMLNLPSLGQLPYQVALFRESVDPAHFPHGVYFTLNGQVHGQLPANFVSTSLKFDYLSDYLLVTVECSSMNEKVVEDFFMASRDRMRRNETYFAIQEVIREELRNHAGLRQHNAMRRQRLIEKALTDEKQTVDFFQDLLKSDPALASLLGSGLKLLTTAGPRTIATFDGRKFPSYFRLAKDPKEGLVKSCPVNKTVRIEFETDAENTYFTRPDSPGRIEVSPPNLCLSSHLWNGIFSTRFQMPWDAKPKDEIHVVVTVTDVEREAKDSPFVCELTLRGVPEQDDRIPPPGKPNPKRPERSPKSDKKDPVLATPQIVEIRRERWSDPALRFDEYSAMKITHSEEDSGYVFYLNVDNAFLVTEMARAKEDNKPLIKYWFVYGLTLCAMGILQEEKRRAQKESKLKSGGEEFGAEEDLREVSKYCNGLARVIIPIIRKLYRGPSDVAQGA